VQKQSLLWRIGNFSEYKSGVVNGNAVVCEKCVDKEGYLFCEISLGKDFSTSLLKNNLYAHHRDLYEEYIRQTREDTKTSFDQIRKKNQIASPAETSEVPSLVAEIQREFSLFNLEKVIHVKADPLAWWKTGKAQYPLLATLTQRVLAVPATSANAERLLSKAGLNLTDKRNRLSGDNIELLVWLREAWLPLEEYEKTVKSNT